MIIYLNQCPQAIAARDFSSKNVRVLFWTLSIGRTSVVRAWKYHMLMLSNNSTFLGAGELTSDDNACLYHVVDSHRPATKLSWKLPYVGTYHEVFAQTIREMKTRQSSTNISSIVPVIQSSGMGKSRLLHEVAGLMVTLPLNVRSAEDDSGKSYIIHTECSL